MGFGGRIRERREELGLSRGKLAAMVGVTVSAIGNYESGVSFPKEEILLRLFDCLETDPNTLFQDSFRKDSVILSQTERQLMEGYRGLSARGRESVRSVVDTLCAYRDEMESGNTTMTQLRCILLISVLKFSIVIIHLNISILISVLIYSTKMTRLYFTSLISVLKFSFAIIHFNTDFSTEKQNGDHPTHFYITNFGINFTIAIIHVSISVLI